MSELTLDRVKKDASPAVEEEDPSKPTHYIGVGASAGGLEALQELFAALPPDTGVGFIVVQHLAPDYKSMMDELLAKHTQMAIVNVEDGQEVEANSIYLIPARRNIMIAEGRLYLSEQMPDQGVNLPIDTFFRSLAVDQQDRAIGVVLSGTGSDGCNGIKALKESGGMVFVQDPQSAKFDGMPYNAIQTGFSDFVLNPESISSQLVSFLAHPLIGQSDQPIELTMDAQQDVLHAIFDLVRSRSKIDFGHYKPSTVARRIERRMSITQKNSLYEYLDLLREDDNEVDVLTREILISVTRFFRNKEAFKYIENQLLDGVLSNSSDDEIRVWVAGCATGEEAYSIAMILDEALERRSMARSIKIFATDLDAAAIQTGSTGKYGREIEQDVNPARLSKYFTKSNGRYEVRTKLRRMVVFANHNMISDPPFSNLDFCSCRNVMIYFQADVQAKVLAAFHFALKKNGIAFFGSAETVGDLKSHFSSIDEHHKIFRKINGAPSLLPTVMSNRQRVGFSTKFLTPGSGSPSVSRRHRSNAREPEMLSVKEGMLKQLLHAAAILDSDMQLAHVYGSFHQYLKRFPEGRVSTKIKDLIIQELEIVLSASLSRAENDGIPVTYRNIVIEIDGEPRSIDLQSSHYPAEGSEPEYFSVVISQRAMTGDQPSAVQSGASVDSDTALLRIRDLEHELLTSRENLQATNEELETTNEELQSANEELMSSNEELQSTNEELQSVNEELFTVNSEFQQKISELLMANDDLDNVLQSTSVGIIFLDSNMVIRRYTNVVSRFFNILSTDTGRPLHHISHNIVYPTLYDDMAVVIRDKKSIFKELFTDNGLPIQMKLLPYRSSAIDSDTLIEGCIIALTDLNPRFVAAEGEAQDNVSPLNRSELDGKAITVLLADDSESDRRVVKKQLSKITNMDISVFEANTVSEAVESLKQNEIDICLVDYRLGVETALELIDLGRQMHSSLPFVLLSGFTREQLSDEFAKVSFDHYINKDEMTPSLLEVSIKHTIGSL